MGNLKMSRKQWTVDQSLMKSGGAVIGYLDIAVRTLVHNLGKTRTMAARRQIVREFLHYSDTYVDN